MIPKSIRWQIQAWHSVLLTLVVSGLLFVFYQFEAREQLHKIDEQLGSTLIRVLPNLVRPEPPNGAPLPEPPRSREDRGREFLDRLSETSTYYVLYRADDSIAKKSANAPFCISFISRHLKAGTNDFRTSGANREVIQYGPNNVALLIGTNISKMTARLHELAWKLLFLGAGVVAFGMFGGWWLAGRSLRPIRAISTAAETIANGDLSKRIAIREVESELGELSAILNHTFERLQRAFEQQSRFTSDVSHELRTPLTVILSQTQLALSKERSAQEYREALETCQRTAQRMRGLIHSMLELASFDAGEYAWRFEKNDLVAIAKDCVASLSPLAEEKEIALHGDFAPTICEMDSEQIRQVIMNLLGNAIQHHRRNGEVWITTRRNAQRVELAVADNGAGISSEHLPHLFERFYRADASRTRKEGSTGLGLAISQAIVKAHGGEIQVESAVGKGSEFRMILPQLQSVNPRKK